MNDLRDHALLVLRAGLGIMIMAHGWPKVAGGPERWERLGGAMESLGITFAPMLWGAAASFTELCCGALLVLGLATRPAAALLVITMLVAAWNHAMSGDGFRGWSHPAETGIGFLAVLIAGAGRFSMDHRLRARQAATRDAPE